MTEAKKIELTAKSQHVKNMFGLNIISI